MIHYPIPSHMQEAYRETGYLKGQFPIAEIIANECLSLPFGPHLNATDQEALLVAMNDNKWINIRK